MNSIKTFLLLLFGGINFCRAQDTTLLLSPTMFSKDDDEIYISEMNGWLFKEGNDTAWAKNDMDITGWKKLKPTELSAKQADKNGKIECWFRIKIKLDTGFGDKSLGFRISTWAAKDFYIDDNLIASFGNTGQNGNPYREHRPYGELPVPVKLKPGNEYTLALHFVDYLSPFPPHQLKSEEMGLRNLIKLTGPKYYSDALNGTREGIAYSTIWMSVSTVLSLLFWLLSIQNRNDKNLRLIALGSTFITLAILSSFLTRYITGLSYVGHMLYDLASGLFWTLLLTIVPLILANIFKRKVSRLLKIYLILIFIGLIISTFFDLTIINVVNYFVLIIVCIYYVISSWKTLRGAQWAIVAGLMFTLFMLLLFIFMSIKYNSTDNFPNVFLYVTGFALPFPLSLMVYVAMRFKEIINEIRENAKKVVQMSEEKKEQALNQQKKLQEEVNRQTAEIRTTLDNLKSTQSQLIQSEKMASLGELTAGIAHEIQNPLNFVNNFSEVSNELISEMVEEVDNGNTNEAKAIAENIKQNLEKIINHGKRADAIVKGMLQHSRSNVGVKEPTDINALADEYLRLAYHGLRAKDNSFNATMKTDFDESIGKINIIPQDIGRVLLNLFNNAFYAVAEKKKQIDDNYEPKISVSTKKINDKVVLMVMDNGNGISQKMVDKIFQPFFTTKPTGQGTGLGLSLSYDIVKAHGGEIKVETKEGEGSEFTIELPLNK
jgi:two-component system NtrC family sensor kinase